MSGPRVRIGIDVGGTFTKAVAVDHAALRLMATAVTPTTHRASEGVARGVVEVFRQLLAHPDLAGAEVKFIGHSTTQATNALLEGDVASVGILGMGAGLEGRRARGQTRVEGVELAPGRPLPTVHQFLDTGAGLQNGRVRAALEALRAAGARVVVASEAFGVDDPAHELAVMQAAAALGLPATGAHEISKLYGLKVRTRTAVVNASILPKMMETAAHTEASVRGAGVDAALMIMRGDGGVMDVNQMRRRPLLTALSGPAASVAGALMYLRVSDGVFFEVGGTSTNIGVIVKGRPMIKYVEVGGHSTFLHSLDVRVLGVAGGSLPRLAGGALVDVGPRSAHIAGFPYACFSPPEALAGCRLVAVRPLAADPADYVAVENLRGERFALTTTCAANVLGLARPGDYARGDPEAARRGFAPLAAALGVSPEAAATRVLELAGAKVQQMIERLVEEYGLDRRATVLVGGGGGAAALIPFVADRLGMRYQIPEHAEVISAIGDALAMVRDVVERTMVDPSPEAIEGVRREAVEAAIASGALAETVEVFVEVDARKHRVRAIAQGATEFLARDLTKMAAAPEERAAAAAASLQMGPEAVRHRAGTAGLDVYEADTVEKRLFGLLRQRATPVRVVDRSGVVRLALPNGVVVATTVAAAPADLWKHLDLQTKFSDAGKVIPPTYLLLGGRVVDLSGLSTADQVFRLARLELAGLSADDPAVILFGVL